MHAGLLPLQLTLFTSRCQVDEDGYNSVATLRDVPLHQTWVLILFHSQICLLVKSTLSDMHAGFIIQIHMFVRCLSARQDIWSFTPKGKAPFPRVCKTCRLLSWTPS